jgi:hypothetical protein
MLPAQIIEKFGGLFMDGDWIGFYAFRIRAGAIINLKNRTRKYLCRRQLLSCAMKK